MLAAVNPCGFALLPAYLALLVTGDTRPGNTRPGHGPRGDRPPGQAPSGNTPPGAGPPGRVAAVGRALLLTAGMTAGFAAVFGAFGLAFTPVADAVQSGLPWFTAGFGALLALLGVWLAAGRRMPSMRSVLPGPRRAPRLGRGLPSMALFGAAYALASLGCTVAPFLAIVVSSFDAGSAGAGMLLWLVYAAGMGLVVGTAAVAVALARTSLVGRMRALGPVAGRTGGVLLMATGGYVAYYGWWELRSRDGGGSDPVIAAAAGLQARLADALESAGPVALAVAFGTVLVAAGLAATAGKVRARRRGTADGPSGRTATGLLSGK